MATKTISIDLEAYQTLSRAKLSPRDSFSQVIKRARWERESKTCGELLALLPSLPTADDIVLERLERAQAADLPPDDSWT
jgi:predicted CopG family antitoxin